MQKQIHNASTFCFKIFGCDVKLETELRKACQIYGRDWDIVAMTFGSAFVYKINELSRA